jgi:hypothetical protein
MNIQDILLQIMRANIWVSYYRIDKANLSNPMPGEYVIIRTGFLDGNDLLLLTNAGFVIEKITSLMIYQDSYSEIHLKRKVND